MLHSFLGIEPPKHPLISIVDFSNVGFKEEMFADKKIINDFYLISFKSVTSKTLIYGRQYYDFEEGTILFLSPSQVFQVGGEVHKETIGWGLYFHPDLLRAYPLERSISQFGFFDYATHEALHLSEREKTNLNEIAMKIQVESELNIDEYSHDLLVSNLGLLLNYIKAMLCWLCNTF